MISSTAYSPEVDYGTTGGGSYQVGEGLAEHVLVQRAGEVGVHKHAIVERLAHDAPHKLEKVQVVGATGLVILNRAVGVGLEGGAPFRHGHEEAEIGVEHLASHHLDRDGVILAWTTDAQWWNRNG
jgi:hypothetical protein